MSMLEEGDGDMERLELQTGWGLGDNTKLIPGFHHECICPRGETTGLNARHDLVCSLALLPTHDRTWESRSSPLCGYLLTGRVRIVTPTLGSDYKDDMRKCRTWHRG